MHAPARSEDIRAEVAELLGVDVAAVQPGDNLISQGLDSIRIMTLAGRWRRQGIAIDFAALAETPTIEAWTRLTSAGGQRADQRTSPAAATGDAASSSEDEPFALAPMQHAMWVGRQDNQQLGGVAGHLYVEFDGGPIDPERLRTAATALARRHPMLRVRFLPDGTQRIIPADQSGAFPVDVEDLRGLSTAERRAAARRYPRHQITPAARRRGIRTRGDAAAGRAVAAARRPGHAGRRRDELSHPDGRPGDPLRRPRASRS